MFQGCGAGYEEIIQDGDVPPIENPRQIEGEKGEVQVLEAEGEVSEV